MFRVRSFGFAFLAAAGMLASLGAAAQVYRIVGPDGKVTFSDKPPADNQARPTIAPSVAMPGAGAPAAGGGLPFELRTAAGKYPVTLYTGEGCGPCTPARDFLASRGIPYTERTVNSNEDAAALRKLSGDLRVPFLTIGSQQLRGYSETEWTQYLDAAGYPKTSQLPPSYRNPPPAPIVAQQQAKPQAPGAAAPAAAQQAPVQQPSLEPTAPGIRF
ncbi:glutaredoxin family protein [Ramlibacter sp. XY19]|uniref:glutaredoxin family protein n=1 Tax=Ramlibacter paludis TaxID=2908000 RepID=UPI0023DB8A7F|nr:glutaredoxin family protein [Ramlibacter paludis]MCG2593731.1 glutaredoxin family protein [Ramlibacter paludis]